MDGLSGSWRQKRRIVTSGFSNHFPLGLGCVLSSSCLSDQQSAGAAKVPVSSTQSLHHSHSELYSRAAAVLPADRWLGWSRGLVWNTIIMSPRLLSFSLRLRFVECHLQAEGNTDYTFSKQAVIFFLCHKGVKWEPGILASLSLRLCLWEAAAPASAESCKLQDINTPPAFIAWVHSHQQSLPCCSPCLYIQYITCRLSSF